jgi:hypothetical protein
VKLDNRFQGGLRIYERIPLIDDILESRRQKLGQNFTAYRNHCYRVANFCLALCGRNGVNPDKIFIAAAFHDLGIWTNRTFDYLGPSRMLAQDYLTKINRAEWTQEVEAMIIFHHKITPYTQNTAWLVEPFRKADWIDVLKGWFTLGLPRGFVFDVLSKFPNMGFHKRLVELTMERTRNHPFSPLPMMKW